MNSLVVAERRKKLLPAKSSQFLHNLRQFDISVDIDGLDQFDKVIAHARLYQRSAYDASYLELAKRRGLPLATKDEPLRESAEELGIAIFQA